MEFRENLKTIYIVGKGPSWSECPSIYFRDHGEDEEIWGIGSVFINHRNLDRIFIMHDLRQEIIFEDRDTVSLLAKYKSPVYTNMRLNETINEFPTRSVLDGCPVHYFVNTVSWMLALASILKPETVYMYGVDYADHKSHLEEKGCVEFWIGYLTALGIRVKKSNQSTLLRTNAPSDIVYGYIPLKKKNGLILEYMPDFLDGTKPQILKRYKLVPVNHKEAESELQ